MRRKRDLFMLLAIAIFLSFSIWACGGDSDNNDENTTDGDVVDTVDNPTDGDQPDTVTDGDVTDGDVTDGDEGDVDGTISDGDESDGDVTDGDTDTCDPACDASKGEYCENGECKVISCTPCTSNDDCSNGETCRSVPDQPYNMCLPSCSADDTTCPSGYSCVIAVGTCYPDATCPAGNVENRNKECQGDTDCPSGTRCLKNQSLVNYPYGFCAAQCNSDSDCLAGDNLKEDCVNSLCLAQCSSHDDCPANVDCVDAFGTGQMYCLHQSLFFDNGQGQMGDDCNPSQQNQCAEGMVCAAKSRTEGTCEQICNDVHNFWGDCPENHFCITYSNVRFGFCQAAGTEPPGHGCAFGDMNADKDGCAMVNGRGSACLGIDPAQLDENQRTECTTPDDCDPNQYPGADPACVQVGDKTYCGTSFCAPFCDDNGSCDDLNTPDAEFSWAPITLADGQCFCAPSPAGTQEPGEACSFGDINADAGYCKAGAACLGIDPSRMENPDACTTADDCDVATYAAGIQCVEVEGQGTFCASSFCAPYCDENGTCDNVNNPNFNWAPVDIQGTCFCLPTPVGNKGPGEACSFGNWNDGYCQAGLNCLGGYDENSQCNTADDCNMMGSNADCGEYNGNNICGFSYCTKQCESDGDCSEFGQGACCQQIGDGSKWCATAEMCQSSGGK